MPSFMIRGLTLHYLLQYITLCSSNKLNNTKTYLHPESSHTPFNPREKPRELYLHNSIIHVLISSTIPSSNLLLFPSIKHQNNTKNTPNQLSNLISSCGLPAVCEFPATAFVLSSSHEVKKEKEVTTVFIRMLSRSSTFGVDDFLGLLSWGREDGEEI